MPQSRKWQLTFNNPAEHGFDHASIAAQPILLLCCVGVPLCGLGVGMFSRLLHSRA